MIAPSGNEGGRAYGVYFELDDRERQEGRSAGLGDQQRAGCDREATADAERDLDDPGPGRAAALLLESALILGLVVFYAAIVALFNVVVDLLLAWLNPTIRIVHRA